MSNDNSLLEYSEIVMKMFNSEDEGFEFYNDYAYEKGFGVRKDYCEWDSGHNEKTLRKFVCSCEGFRAEKHLTREIKMRRSRNITRCGCPAKLVIALDHNTEQWYVKDFIDEHNHSMIEPDLSCFLRSHRRISDEQKAEIVLLQISGIRKHQIMDIMLKRYGGYDRVGFTSRDLYNFLHRNKLQTLSPGDAQTLINYMIVQKRRDPDFSFQYKRDGRGHLTGVLWCDFESQKDYRAFGDVVVFDGTYKTNKYNLPLVPFVGVNHHKSTVLFACGVVAHEDTKSYVWLLRSFSDAMSQKHPVSVITDGDLAMQKAISIVWPNASHRLCGWHIENNIVSNIKDAEVKEGIRCFLYDRCSIEEIEKKWLEFLKKNEVTDKDSWLYQMYERRKVWCAAYHASKRYLGLRSNQRSESLHSRIQFNLDRKMSLVELLQHFDNTVQKLRIRQANLDFEASYKPCLEPDTSIIVNEAAERFTPSVYYADVQYSLKTVSKCFLIEEMDGYNIVEYKVGRVDKGEKQYFVECEICVHEDKVKEISCSCLKLQSLGTPCSHILFVLGLRGESKLPDCCVLERWTMGAKRGFPPTRKSTMYDYSDSVQRYHELHNISQMTSFAASQSLEAYERLKRVLEEEAAMILPNRGEGEGGRKRFGPVLTQGGLDDYAESYNVLDPICVPGRGAPKKKMKSSSDKSNKKCTLCKEEGHNRRTCYLRDEETMLPEDVLDI
ncbi:hypothetical protein ACP70R_028652 [Stipagrostis hirtigluma subsp. patula]